MYNKFNGKMGLTNESQGSGNWLTITYGEICKTVSSGTPGAVERTNKNGKVVHELKYNALEGTLKKIFVSPAKKEEYEDQWVFVIDDGSEEYCVALNYDSGLACAILFRVPNMNLERPMKLISYNIEKTKGSGDFRPFIAIHQDGQKIEPYFTKDEKHGLPEWKVVMIGNKKHYDRSEMLAFLKKMVDEKVNPKLAKLYPVDHVEEEPEEAPSDPGPGVDDLPF